MKRGDTLICPDIPEPLPKTDAIRDTELAAGTGDVAVNDCRDSGCAENRELVKRLEERIDKLESAMQGNHDMLLAKLDVMMASHRGHTIPPGRVEDLLHQIHHARLEAREPSSHHQVRAFVSGESLLHLFFSRFDGV